MVPDRTTSANPARPLGLRIVLFIVTALAVLGASAIALFGAWVGSTLAVFHGGPVWLALVGAFACFFLVPLGWELVADRQQVGGRVRDAILRSSVLSLVLVAVLLTTHAGSTFKALATRGDWFLAGAKTPAAESIRGFLHGAANKLEWLYELARTQYDDLVDNKRQTADAMPAPGSQPVGTRVTPSAPQPRTRRDKSGRYANDHVGRETRYTITRSELTWPLPAVIHPAVLAMPEEAKTSIAAVGRYLETAEPDPLMRVKAIHDFVATWVAYDVEGLRSGDYKKDGRQMASRVFEDRIGVCAGYANLMVALGTAAGSEIIFVTGDARKASDYIELARDELPAPDAGHAWNAAQVNGTWYLLDATWDAGTVNDGEAFKPGYRTTYLFIPPQLARWSHLPDAPEWQLLADPMDRGTWLRQPLLRPEGAALGLGLRAQSATLAAVRDELSGLLVNSGEVWVQADLEGGGIACRPWVPSAGDGVKCKLGALDRRTALNLFGATARSGAYTYLGSLFVDPD